VRRLLAGGWFRRRRAGRSLGVELLYLPHWLVVHETRQAPVESAGADRPDTGSVTVLVCRLSGVAARLREETVFSTSDVPRLPPRLDPDEATRQASEFVDRLLLAAARGRRRRERGPLLRAEPCAYPYWVEYLRARRGIDFHALDAVSGQRAGAAVLSGIATGLATLPRNGEWTLPPD